LLWSTVSFAGFYAYSCTGDKCEGEKLLVRGILPRTGYSIRDVDQVVALGVGIVTLLLCICDIIQNYRFSINDECEGWRRRCIAQIESGDADVEITQWTIGLDRIEKKAKCKRTRAKCERTRARHRVREQKTWDGRPKAVVTCVEDYIIQRRLELMLG
jgi:hypothetical protein